MLDVEFSRLTCVMCSLVMMPVGRMCVMAGSLVVACLVVPGGFTMMSGRVLVMLGCFMVVLRRFFGHSAPPFEDLLRSAARKLVGNCY